MVTIEWFPQEFIDLQAELLHHPDLMEKLANHPAAEWEIKLAEIASHCDILLNATYTPEDVLGICQACTNKLIKKRTGILILN